MKVKIQRPPAPFGWHWDSDPTKLVLHSDADERKVTFNHINPNGPEFTYNISWAPKLSTKKKSFYKAVRHFAEWYIYLHECSTSSVPVGTYFVVGEGCSFSDELAWVKTETGFSSGISSWTGKVETIIYPDREGDTLWVAIVPIEDIHIYNQPKTSGL